MLKTALRVVLLICFSGTLLISCQKDDKRTAPVGVRAAQNSQSLLIDEMVKDELVQADYVATTAFLKQHVLWFQSLTSDEQRERRALVDASLASGTAIPDPSHTAAETAAFAAAMQDYDTQIDAKFPALSTLGQPEQSQVIGEVYKQLSDLGLGGENPGTLDGNCGAGYRACCRSCRGNFSGTQYARCIDGCYAGWYACYFSYFPQQP